MVYTNQFKAYGRTVRITTPRKQPFRDWHGREDFLEVPFIQQQNLMRDHALDETGTLEAECSRCARCVPPTPSSLRLSWSPSRRSRADNTIFFIFIAILVAVDINFGDIGMLSARRATQRWLGRRVTGHSLVEIHRRVSGIHELVPAEHC